MQKIVHTMREKIGLPSIFALDACRHGGMTELGETSLTDGQGRALSAHKSQQSYEGYAKRTMERALSATRKRHAHRLANAAGTEFRNEVRNRFRNDTSKRDDIPCPYRKLDPEILMVESTEHRPSFDTPLALNGPSIGRILPQREVRAYCVVIV
jgi:hypothetical protein